MVPASPSSEIKTPDERRKSSYWTETQAGQWSQVQLQTHELGLESHSQPCINELIIPHLGGGAGALLNSAQESPEPPPAVLGVFRATLREAQVVIWSQGSNWNHTHTQDKCLSLGSSFVTSPKPFLLYCLL